MRALGKGANARRLRDLTPEEKEARRQAEQLRGAGYTADDIKKMNGEFMNMFHNPHTFHQNVTAVANEYDLDAEDAEQLYDFRADKPAYGRKLSPEQLFHKFLSRAKPETRERMQEHNAHKGQGLAFGFGVNTGTALAGNVGGLERMEYTLIGDAVNLAKRLQENAGPGQILLSEISYETVRDRVVATSCGSLTVKGRTTPVTVYEITALRS